jgi:hypothetical protein
MTRPVLALRVPALFLASREWERLGWGALAPAAVCSVAFAFIGWLNVGPGVRGLRAGRAKVEAMFADE